MCSKADKIIAEAFTSIQGEGVDVGKKVFFIRTHGCNLACKWCDTKTEGRISEEDLLFFMGEYKKQIPPDIVITGGEPTIHNLLPLIYVLETQFANTISVETNGLLIPEWLDRCHITLSPKPPSAASVDANKIISNVFDLYDRSRKLRRTFNLKIHLKSCVQTLEDLDWQLQIYEALKHKVDDFVLQPVTCDDMPNMVQLMIQSMPRGSRIIPQTHKFMEVR